MTRIKIPVLKGLYLFVIRTVLNSDSDYETLLRIIGSVNLESSRVQNILITTYKRQVSKTAKHAR